jgi:hypothetical protein
MNILQFESLNLEFIPYSLKELAKICLFVKFMLMILFLDLLMNCFVSNLEK